MNRLTVTLLEIPTVTAPNAPVRAKVRLQNLTEHPIAGQVSIGGPTEDIEPSGPTALPFTLDAGQSKEAEFAFTFAPGSVRADYPVHAFVEITQGGEGTLTVARTVRVDFGTSPGEATAVGAETLVELAPPPELSGLNGLLEQWRLEALGDYVRTEEEPVEGSVFRLGTDKEAFRVAIIPGEHGILDGRILFIGPDRRLHFHGLHLELRLPPGVLEASEEARLHPEVTKPVETEKGIAFEHYLSAGQWGTMVRIDVLAEGSTLKLRASSTDEIAAFGLRSSSLTPIAVVGGDGDRIETGNGWTAEISPSFFRAGRVGFEVSDGLSLLAATTGEFHRLSVDPKAKQTRIETVGGEWLTLEPGMKSPQDLIYGSNKFPAPPSGMQRLWLDLEHGEFASTKARLEDLQRYDLGPKAVILHRPQSEELPQPQPADVQAFATYLQAAGIPWGLDDQLSVVSPLEADFDLASLAFGPDRAPFAAGAGQYLVRPDQFTARLEARFKTWRELAPPNLGIIGEIDRLNSGYSDRTGGWHSPQSTKQTWTEIVGFTRELLGKDAIVLAQSSGSWSPANADGVVLPPRAEPNSGVPMPWPFAGGPLKLRLPAERNPRTDLLTLLRGDGVLASHRDWGREMVRRAWFLRPMATALSETAALRVEVTNGDHRRLRLEKEGDRTFWSNWGEAPWPLEKRTIAPYGFEFASKHLTGGLRLVEGTPCEVLAMPDSWYVNATVRRPPLVARPLSCRMTLSEPGSAHVEIDWWSSLGLPYGTEVMLLGYHSNEPWTVAFQASLGASSVPSEWKGKVTASAQLDLGALPIGEFLITTVLRTPTGRPIAVRSDQVETRGPYADFAARMGRLQIERIEEGVVQEIAFRPEPAAEGQVIPESAPTVEPLVDVGWAQTNGAFRLERIPAGFRLTPLPDSTAFEIVLRPEIPGFKAAEVESLRSRDLYGDGQEDRAVPVDGEVLRWKHQPRIFSYDLILK